MVSPGVMMVRLETQFTRPACQSLGASGISPRGLRQPGVDYQLLRKRIEELIGAYLAAGEAPDGNDHFCLRGCVCALRLF